MVCVPDLPGCFSAGDTLDEAMENAKEAIELWLEVAIDDGMAVPEPKPLVDHQRKREFRGWTWGLVTIDIASLSDKAERINITLPSRVLRRIDQAAKAARGSRGQVISPGGRWAEVIGFRKMRVIRMSGDLGFG